MKSAAQQAAENEASGLTGYQLMTGKRKSYERPTGKIVFDKPDGMNTQMRITNASVGYSKKKQLEFYEMIQVLQAEGKLGDSGFITIEKLEAM